jgi:hypothetical protein
LAVASVVAVGAVALVAVAHVNAAASVLAQLVHAVVTSEQSGGFARHLSDIAHFACPSRLTFAHIGRTPLDASSAIFTGRLAAPVHKLLAIRARPAGGAVTGVVALIAAFGAGASIFAGILVAVRPGHLAVGASVAIGADAGVVVDAVNAGAAVQAA